MLKNAVKNPVKNLVKIAALAAVIVLVQGCLSGTLGGNFPLAQGDGQLNLVVGQTTKNDVLGKLGSPNFTTRDSARREVWSYQRAAQVTESSQQYGMWTILFAEQTDSASGLDAAPKTTMIIKFDSGDVVSDFSSR